MTLMWSHWRLSQYDECVQTTLISYRSSWCMSLLQQAICKYVIIMWNIKMAKYNAWLCQLSIAHSEAIRVKVVTNTFSPLRQNMGNFEDWERVQLWRGTCSIVIRECSLFTPGGGKGGYIEFECKKGVRAYRGGQVLSTSDFRNSTPLP